MSALPPRTMLPKFLLEKRQLVASVTFTSFFALLLLVVSVPLTDNVWFRLGRSEGFLLTAVFCLLALCVLIVSKTLMHSARNSGNFTVGLYIFWSFAEIVLIALLYTFFTIEGFKYGIIDMEYVGFVDVFPPALAFTSLLIGLPTLISALYFTVEDRENVFRLTNYDEVVSDAPLPITEERRITLFDNGGELKFSVSPDSLYFIEADDNYIQAWYTDSAGEMHKYMLRCRLKTVENSFADSELVRAHRKYIINIRKVRVLSNEGGSYYVELDSDATPRIPISKTYEQAVLARFNTRY